MSSQGEKKAYLEANQKGKQIPAGGDFVYLRRAVFPIRVIIDGQPITMEAGEKRRIPRKEPGRQAFDSFEVDNTANVAQSVTFVVGEGDYEKIIVSGELNVSAYVTSAGNGVSAALPDKITKEVGLDNNNVSTTSSGIVLTTSPGLGSNAKAVFYWDDEFWAVTQQNLYRLHKTTDGVFAETIPLSAILPGPVNGAAVNTRGEIFVDSAQNIHKLDFEGNNFGSVVALGGLFTGTGGASIGDKVYFLTLSIFGPPTDIWNIFEYDTITGATRSVADPINHGNVLDMRDGVLYRHGFGAGSAYAVDPVTLEVATVATPNIMVGGQAQTAFSPMEDLCATGNNTDFSVREASDATHYGKIWVQEVGDVTTRRYLALLDEYVWYPRNGKTVMVGKVLKAILASIERDYDVNYLDRVVSIAYSDGLNTHLINSGTESWALRGLDDEIHLALDSEVTVEILPRS